VINTFEMLKELVDFETTASHYGITFNRSKKALCPFHDDNNPSLHNYDTHGHCFVCNKSYDIIDLEAHFKSLSPFEAAKSLADKYGIKLPEFKNEDKDFYNKQNQAQELLERFIKYTNKKIKQHPEALQFLKNKGLTEEDIDKYRIGYVGNENLVTNKLKKKEEIQLAKEIGFVNEKGDYFKNRIIFSVLSYGKPVFLTGRAFPSGDPKYLHLKTSDFFTKKIAFAENLNKDKCVIVESITDAIALLNTGMPAVALLGTNPGEKARQRLSNSKAKLYIALDSDEAGKVASYKLAREVKGYILDLGSQKDADELLVELGEDEFKKLVESSIYNAEYYLDFIIENDSIPEALKEIAQLELETDKDIWINKLQKKHDVSIRSLKKDLKNIQEKLKLDTNKKSEDQESDAYDPLSEYSDDEIEEAKELLKDKNLLDKTLSQITKTGYIGEFTNKQILYLSFTSRLFDEGISNVIKGESSTGKSALVKAVLNLFPESEYKEFTSISPQALYYMKELDLSHKILIIFEAHGSEKADYPIRSSISEGELRLLVTTKNKDTNSFESKEIVIPAKGLSYVETTTKSRINPENQTRLFDLYLDNSEEQTRKIIISKTKIIDKEVLDKENRVFQVLQLLLEKYEVYIPYAEILANLFPINKVRVRRDFPRFLTLIKTSCLLHQYQRNKITKNGREYLQANIIDDYKIAYRIANIVLSQTLKEITPRQEKIIEAIEKKFNDWFSPKELKKVNEIKKIPDSTLKKDLAELKETDFLEWNEEKGTKSKYKLAGKPKDFLKLPTPEKLNDIYLSPLAHPDNIQSLDGVTDDNRAIAQSSPISPIDGDSAMGLNRAKTDVSPINPPNSTESLDNMKLGYSANENIEEKIKKRDIDIPDILR